MLRLSASAREMLIEAAAKKWNVNNDDCYAENGEVIHRSSGKKLNYGAIVEDASKLTPPANVTLKDSKHYKIIRKPLPRQDTPLKVNGKAIFGLDKKIPGMMYAVVERNPRFQGKVKSFDATAAKAIPGVKHVIAVKMRVPRSVQNGNGRTRARGRPTAVFAGKHYRGGEPIRASGDEHLNQNRSVGRFVPPHLGARLI